eukprot:6193232-Pleurochrysis_carterae.AAC.1
MESIDSSENRAMASSCSSVKRRCAPCLSSDSISSDRSFDEPDLAPTSDARSAESASAAPASEYMPLPITACSRPSLWLARLYSASS